MQEEHQISTLISTENPEDFIFGAALDPCDLELLSDA